jgi:RNA polymerase sigma-70 factor (ECF subfamily)
MSAACDMSASRPSERADDGAWVTQIRQRLSKLRSVGAGQRRATGHGGLCLTQLLPASILAARPDAGAGDRALSRAEVETRVSAAERREFDKVVAAYQNKVYNLIYRLINDEEEALDLTQDTFINAYRAFHRFRGEASIYTWLYRIAVNRTKNRLKQRSRQQVVEGTSVDEPVAAGEDSIEREIEDWSLAPERRLENQELGRRVDELVAALPPDFREVVVLRDYQDLTYREIADIVGISVKAVKSRLFRARSVLREKLTRYLMAEE